MFKCVTNKSLTASQLKWIAITAMVIDHIAAIILTPIMHANSESLTLVTVLYSIILCLRLIGRIAFPLFAFLIVNGYLHTSNKKKYLIRLVSFAIVSEPIFNFALTQQSFFNPDYQNVFFTLALGLVGIWGYDTFKQTEGSFTPKGLLILACCLISAIVLKCDYGSYGVLLIFIMYLLYKTPARLIGGMFLLTVIMFGLNLGSGPLVNYVVAQMGFEDGTLGTLMTVIVYCFNNLQLMSVLAGLFIIKYNGEKGKSKWKYLFYWFYPVHLFILGLLSIVIAQTL